MASTTLKIRAISKISSKSSSSSEPDNEDEDTDEIMERVERRFNLSNKQLNNPANKMSTDLLDDTKKDKGTADYDDEDEEDVVDDMAAVLNIN